MVNFVLTHPLAGLENFENGIKLPDLNISIQPIPAMLQLFAKKGKESNVMSKLGFSTNPGIGANTPEFKALPLAPGQWMLISNKKTPTLFREMILSKVARIAYLSEQSDARISIRISGKNARKLMSRGCRLDLHPSVTGKDFCAQTQMAQCGVLIHQINDDASYELYVYSGFARSFWHWLEQCAVRFK